MAWTSLCAVFIKIKGNNDNNNNKRIMAIRILEFNQEIYKIKKNGIFNFFFLGLLYIIVG